MKRRFRLTRSTDFKRVRRTGKSYAHPLVLLVASASNRTQPRVGFAAGRTVGGAVQRNRAKRVLRAAIRPLMARIVPGVDLLLLARPPLSKATCSQAQEVLLVLLRRAALLLPDDG